MGAGDCAKLVDTSFLSFNTSMFVLDLQPGPPGACNNGSMQGLWWEHRRMSLLSCGHLHCPSHIVL